MLSLALATVAGSTPAGTSTSMWSANGTRTRSESAPPQSPPNCPKPNVDIFGTVRQSPVWPRAQRSHSPHEIWKGTTTRAPGSISVMSAVATTSATNS